MNCSDIGLKVLAAKENLMFKTNAQFWNKYSDIEILKKELTDNINTNILKDKLLSLFDFDTEKSGIISVFDDDFPVINNNVKNNSEKPYLLFYEGDINLLKDLNNNVAVIGLIDPDDKIAKREEKIIENLVQENLVIVSGLAAGCDSIAHIKTIQSQGKTIAILPSPLNKIYPAENRKLAREIVESGGLLISEYYKEPTSKFESINRFVERDRLQAMFAKVIILIASYRKNEGDSGSRHAMQAASKYKIQRFIMYNENLDKDDMRFGLNKDLFKNKEIENVEVLQKTSISCIKKIINPDIISKAKIICAEQLSLL